MRYSEYVAIGNNFQPSIFLPTGIGSPLQTAAAPTAPVTGTTVPTDALVSLSLNARSLSGEAARAPAAAPQLPVQAFPLGQSGPVSTEATSYLQRRGMKFGR